MSPAQSNSKKQIPPVVVNRYQETYSTQWACIKTLVLHCADTIAMILLFPPPPKLLRLFS
jgi:hypothetical protein